MCLIFHVMLFLGFYFKCNFHLHLQESSAVSKLKDEKTSVTKQNEKLLGELVLFDFYSLNNQYWSLFSSNESISNSTLLDYYHQLSSIWT